MYAYYANIYIYIYRKLYGYMLRVCICIYRHLLIHTQVYTHAYTNNSYDPCVRNLARRRGLRGDHRIEKQPKAAQMLPVSGMTRNSSSKMPVLVRTLKSGKCCKVRVP